MFKKLLLLFSLITVPYAMCMDGPEPMEQDQEDIFEGLEPLLDENWQPLAGYFTVPRDTIVLYSWQIQENYDDDLFVFDVPLTDDYRFKVPRPSSINKNE